MNIRHATIEDTPAMGAVMVEAFLAAHKDQYPKAAWQKRITEWTPAISAAGWASNLRDIEAAHAAGKAPDECLYVARDVEGDVERDVALDETNTVVGLIFGFATTADRGSGTKPAQSMIGEIGALYVKPSHQGKGIGRQLVRVAATHLASIGMTMVHIPVLAANTEARLFYEAIGGKVIAESIYEEEGYQLPAVVYGWRDIRVLQNDS